MVFSVGMAVAKLLASHYGRESLMNVATGQTGKLHTLIKRCVQLGCLLLAVDSHAGDLTTIESQAVQGQGVATINQAAGNNNIQSNSHVLGTSTSISSMDYINQLRQSTPNANELNERKESLIESQAFANFQGLMSVNQVSGTQNIQANLGSIAVDSALDSIVGLGLSDEALVQVSSELAPSYQVSNYQTDIAPDSLLNAQGVIQINQISGDNNIAINQFSLQLPSGN